MQAKCVTCDILLDVACANPACTGHHNESRGDKCVYCATNERETMGFLHTFSHSLLSSSADIETDWTEYEARSLRER
jgi:hypothetical protein